MYTTNICKGPTTYLILLNCGNIALKRKVTAFHGESSLLDMTKEGAKITIVHIHGVGQM